MRIVRFSKNMILSCINDKNSFGCVLLSFQIKHKFGSSSVNFNNKKELFDKLKIGSDKLNRIYSSSKFNLFFREDKNSLTSRKIESDGDQLTFITGDSGEYKKNDLFINVSECDFMDRSDISDYIYMALIQDKIFHVNKVMSESGMEDPILFDINRFSKDYGISKSKVKKILNKGYKCGAFSRITNREIIATSDDPKSYIKDYKKKKTNIIGAIFSKDKYILHQLPNSYKTPVKSTKRKFYINKSHSFTLEYNKEKYSTKEWGNLNDIPAVESETDSRTFTEKIEFVYDKTGKWSINLLEDTYENYLDLKTEYGFDFDKTVNSINYLKQKTQKEINKKISLKKAKSLYIEQGKDKKHIARQISDHTYLMILLDKYLHLDPKSAAKNIPDLIDIRKRDSESYDMMKSSRESEGYTNLVNLYNDTNYTNSLEEDLDCAYDCLASHEVDVCAERYPSFLMELDTYHDHTKNIPESYKGWQSIYDVEDILYTSLEPCVVSGIGLS